MRWLILLTGLLSLAAGAPAATPAPLWLKGYSVVPSPRQVSLAGGDVRIDETWSFDPGNAPPGHIGPGRLRSEFAFSTGASTKTLRLRIVKGAVQTRATDGIDRQAYRLTIGKDRIEIVANGDPGLLYGVETLIQLARRDAAGRRVVPEGTIEDWPARELRFLHWDTKHHQDRIETLKRYLDWCARLKVNMIGFELEDKFEYPSNPLIGAPGAFTTTELQEIVNYALARYIQVVPVVQSPAHMAYVLKHPRYAHLKADGNNYQTDFCDERTYQLIFSMYDDVIRATKGVDYFFVSTDEIYYAGIGAHCQAPYNPENRSLAWARFAARAHDHVASRGRRMLAWLEYPLTAQHLKLIPAGVIDGVVGDPEFVPIEMSRGMRQLSYTSMQGAELLFPNHLSLDGGAGHLADARSAIGGGTASRMNPIGVFGAAWDDSGLHNETFWLGWSGVAQWGWNPGGATVEQHTAEFMNLYYGPDARNMIEIYRTLQKQARGWETSWDRVLSKVRGKGYGNSYGKGLGVEKYDLTLSPPVPRLPDMKLVSTFRQKYGRLIEQARERMDENTRLVEGLTANFARVERNHYNLEVLLALANFMGHHWRLIDGLADAEESLERAQAAAERDRAQDAVGQMLAAHDNILKLDREGRAVFKDLTAVFEKSQFKKGRSVAGRAFIHVFDDTKDHWADRRADLSYMRAPEESIGLAEWRKSLLSQIETYAKTNNIPLKGLGEKRLEE
jgi:hypothetical protein